MLDLDVIWPKAAAPLGLVNAPIKPKAPAANEQEEILPDVPVDVAAPSMAAALEKERIEAAAAKQARNEKDAKYRQDNLALIGQLKDIQKPAVRLERPCLVKKQGVCKLRAMDMFFESLRETALKKRKEPVRISQYGDSLISGDGFTGQLRNLLQSRFGDGGHGYIPLKAPSRFMGFHGLRVSSSESWKLDSITRSSKKPRALGVGGASFVPKGATRLKIQSRDKSRTFDRLGVLASVNNLNKPVQFHLKTEANKQQISVPTKALQDEVHWLSIKPTPNVELSNFNHATYYGIVLENQGHGVVVDNFGMLSSRVSSLVRMDAKHWKQQLKARGVNLASFSFGTNSAFSGKPSSKWLNRYKGVYGYVLNAAQDVRDNRDCLVLSILTRASKQNDRILQYPSVKPMVAAQRETALKAGCAFWNMNAAMGGEKGPAKWYKNSPRLLGSDFTHPTSTGYRKLAKMFHGALLYEFKLYLEGRTN